MSGRQHGKLHPSDKDDAANGHNPGGASEKDSNKKDRKRSGEVGRALRSVYDDTLRESVPDDFMDLLGKLD